MDQCRMNGGAHLQTKIMYSIILCNVNDYGLRTYLVKPKQGT